MMCRCNVDEKYYAVKPRAWTLDFRATIRWLGNISPEDTGLRRVICTLTYQVPDQIARETDPLPQE